MCLCNEVSNLCFIRLTFNNMPTTDWNWFFSSVAQSSAAIVGIFGAFIVTKILANQGAFAEKELRAHELITQSKKLAESVGRLPFEWYHRHNVSNNIEDMESHLDDDGSLSPDLLYKRLNFSPYFDRNEALEAIARAMSAREQRLRRESEEISRQLEQAKLLGHSGILSAMNTNPLKPFGVSSKIHLAPQINAERDRIDRLYFEVKHHVRMVSDFHAVVAPNPESSPVITASLILIVLLFFIGVVFPLGMMPLPTGLKPIFSISEVGTLMFSIRGAILAIVSILFTAMLAMFFVMNIRLRYQMTLINDLESFRNLSKYSQYFENREINDAMASE